jgi:UDP-glucose:(heptosyl)LPS alpha-1,3-glucosyltransferase
MDRCSHEPKHKMKIAFVLDKFLPSRGGERYFLFLIDELLNRGHDVHVCAAEVEDMDGRVVYHKIPVWRFPRSLRMFSFMRNADALIRGEAFDVVHGLGQNLALMVLNPHGGVEKAYLRGEFASIGFGFYYVYRFLKRYLSPRHYLELWIQKQLYTGRDVRQIIAVSRMVKEEIIFYYKVPKERITAIFNSVDIRRFHPDNRVRWRGNVRAELGIDEKETVLLFVSNNYRLKGLRPLIRAVALLRRRCSNWQLRLLVAGRGHINRYQFLARRLRVANRVLFLGSIKDTEIYYAASDIYVHPTFYDSFALTILEALATGLPVVTSRFAGAADAIVEGVSGRVIENPADVPALADAIQYFISEEERQKAQPVARATAEEYSPEYNLRETLKVYRQVTNS